MQISILSARCIAAALLILLFITAASTLAQTTAFTYQGRLTDTALPGTSAYLMEFKLFGAVSGGTAIGTLSDVPVSVTNNIFTVQLNFTAANAFDGTDRFLEISVKRNAGDTYTTLTPRQPVTSAPYAIRSLNADTADTAASAANFTGNLSGDISGTQGATVVSTVGGQTAASVGSATQSINTATSANTPNTLVRRDASGNFSANIINAVTQYNIGGNRVLSVAGLDNFFAGVGAGQNNTGTQNAFVGKDAGLSNTSGQANAFFGQSAGQANTIGNWNAFFGSGAGFSNVNGDENAFFGNLAGSSNLSGYANSFFGRLSGDANTTGSANSFFGSQAGYANLSGANNTFIGTNSGDTNATGTFNTTLGAGADVATNDLDNATAIGAGSVVSNSNTVVLGRAADTVQVPGNLNVAGNFTGNFTVPASNITGVLALANGGTGSATQNFVDLTTAQTVGGDKTFSNTLAAAQYNIGGNRVLSIGGAVNDNNIFAGLNTGVTGVNNSFVGGSAGAANTTGQSNTFVGDRSGQANTNGDANSFVGAVAGGSNTQGTNNSFFGTSAGSSNTTGSFNTAIGNSASVGGNLTNATAIGANAIVSQSNSLVLGNNANVGIGTTLPSEKLHVVGNGLITGNLTVTGSLNANLPTGSANYIQNQNAVFQPGNFSINGVGTANILRAEQQYNIGGNRVLSTGVGNSLVLGNNVNIGIGTSAPASKLDVVATSTNGGDNTATFSAPNIGPNISHLHFGTSGDWYIRSAASAGKVVLQDTGGNVGIGTAAPESKLHVNGASEILSTGTAAGFKFRDRGSTSFNDDWVWYSQGNTARLFEAGSGDLVAVQTNGNVGLGTSTPNARLEVNGYTKLGSDAPSIRVKKLTGTTHSSGGVSVSISHGLDASKILSVSVMVNDLDGKWIGPNHSDFTGYFFSWDFNTFNISVRNHPTSSAFILSRPIKILIIYEQ